MLLRAIAARSVFLSALPRSHSFMVAEAVKKPLKDGSPCMGTFPTWGKNQPLKVRNCRCPYSDRHDDRTGTESMQGLLMAGADLRHTASSRTSRSRYFDKRFTEERAHQHCAFTNTAEDWLGTTGYSSFRGFPGQSSCVLVEAAGFAPTHPKERIYSPPQLAVFAAPPKRLGTHFSLVGRGAVCLQQIPMRFGKGLRGHPFWARTTLWRS